uniref:Aldo_ket_red domain-containing protein n=1 Tax=Macrostomum lignano TaxID=282301 RepID=A0A1I8JN49_9PLAT
LGGGGHPDPGLRCGINFFDTAEVYAAGRPSCCWAACCESFGISLREPHDSGELVPASAALPPHPCPPAAGRLAPLLLHRVHQDFLGGKAETERGLSRKHIVEGAAGLPAAAASWTMWTLCSNRPDPLNPMEEIVRAFSFCIDRGWAFYWGTRCGRSWSCRLPELFAKLGLGAVVWSRWPAAILSGKYDDGVPVYSRASLRAYSWLRAIKSSARRAGPATWQKLKELAELGDPPGHARGPAGHRLVRAERPSQLRVAGRELATELRVREHLRPAGLVPKLTAALMAEIDRISGEQARGAVKVGPAAFGLRLPRKTSTANPRRSRPRLDQAAARRASSYRRPHSFRPQGEGLVPPGQEGGAVADVGLSDLRGGGKDAPGEGDGLREVRQVDVADRSAMWKLTRPPPWLLSVPTAGEVKMRQKTQTALDKLAEFRHFRHWPEFRHSDSKLAEFRHSDKLAEFRHSDKTGRVSDSALPCSAELSNCRRLHTCSAGSRQPAGKTPGPPEPPKPCTGWSLLAPFTRSRWLVASRPRSLRPASRCRAFAASLDSDEDGSASSSPPGQPGDSDTSGLTGFRTGVLCEHPPDVRLAARPISAHSEPHRPSGIVIPVPGPVHVAGGPPGPEHGSHDGLGAALVIGGRLPWHTAEADSSRQSPMFFKMRMVAASRFSLRNGLVVVSDRLDYAQHAVRDRQLGQLDDVAQGLVALHGSTPGMMGQSMPTRRQSDTKRRKSADSKNSCVMMKLAAGVPPCVRGNSSLLVSFGPVAESESAETLSQLSQPVTHRRRSRRSWRPRVARRGSRPRRCRRSCHSAADQPHQVAGKGRARRWPRLRRRLGCRCGSLRAGRRGSARMFLSPSDFARFQHAAPKPQPLVWPT